MKQNVRNVLIVIVVVVIGLQFVPIRVSNPESTGEIETDPEIVALIERSCYDCHSNESHWPWYARVAPVSWLIVHDVKEAREEFNFSEWENLSELQQKSMRLQIWRQVEGEHMPLPKYLWLHGDARLSDEDRDLFRSWAGVEDLGEEHDHSAH